MAGIHEPDDAGATVAALRADLRQDAERTDRRLTGMQRAYEHLASDVLGLRQKVERMDGQIGKAHDWALGAGRNAEDSRHALEVLAASINSHLAHLDEARSEREALVMRELRGVATTAAEAKLAVEALAAENRRRFGFHRDAIAALARQGARVQVLQVVILAVLAALAATTMATAVAPDPRAPERTEVDGGQGLK